MNGSGISGKRKTARRITAAVLLFLTAGAMYLSPPFIRALFEREGYSDWMQLKTEPRVLIINVWHIVGFKPYLGSLGSWLTSRADEFKSKYIGIYFSVKSFTPDEAARLMERGMLPDIVSFAGGTYSPELIKRLDESRFAIDGYSAESGECDGCLYALSYCASGKLLLYDPSTASGMSREDIIGKAGSAEEFERGKALSCICDLKTAGDLYRAVLSGNAPYFEAEPYETAEKYPQLVQYVGIRREIDDIKLEYALGFLEHLIGSSSQSKLGELGLMPINTRSDPVFDQKWLDELYSQFDPYKIEGCFKSY